MGRAWVEHGAPAERAATALTDVAAPALSLPDSGLRRRPCCSRPVDVAEIWWYSSAQMMMHT